jgi:hypothetical protein
MEYCEANFHLILLIYGFNSLLPLVPPFVFTIGYICDLLAPNTHFPIVFCDWTMWMSSESYLQGNEHHLPLTLNLPTVSFK